MNYTEVEGKVREATNDEPWGPTGPLMQELAHATFTYEHFPEVMSMLWKRMLQDNKTNWRRTYKVNILPFFISYSQLVSFESTHSLLIACLYLSLFSIALLRNRTEFAVVKLFGKKWFGTSSYLIT